MTVASTTTARPARTKEEERAALARMDDLFREARRGDKGALERVTSTYYTLAPEKRRTMSQHLGGDMVEQAAASTRRRGPHSPP